MRRSFPLASCLVLALLLSGCDVCFGTFACGRGGVSGEGHLLWHLDGQPAAWVRVEFIPTGGARLSQERLTAYSARDGIFALRAQPLESGPVEGRLVFFPPEPFHQFVFSVEGVRLLPVDARGDARYLGSWGVGPFRGPPHISYAGELHFGPGATPAAGVPVHFRRTGGIAVTPDTLTVVSDSIGHFPLFMAPAGVGEVTGELVVRPPAPYREQRFPVRLHTLVGQDEVRFLGVFVLTP